MTTEANEEPLDNASGETGSAAEEPTEKKLPGVPGHLQAAVQQLIGTADAPKASSRKRDSDKGKGTE